jgi:hypothetical protein
MGLAELANRCEQAMEPNWALEQEIAQAVGYAPDCSLPFTASINAAMTLVPDGALWKLDYLINIGNSETFERPDGEPTHVYRAGVGIGNVPVQWEYARHFASPALALCAAVLRVRGAAEKPKASMIPIFGGPGVEHV